MVLLESFPTAFWFGAWSASWLSGGANVLIRAVFLCTLSIFRPILAYSLRRPFGRLYDKIVLVVWFPDFIVFEDVVFIDYTSNSISEPIVCLFVFWEGWPCCHVVFEPWMITNLFKVL